MRPSSLSSFPFFPLFLFLFPLFFIFHPINARNLIHETCKKCAQTDPNINYNFCVTSLEAAPHASCAETLRDLGFISIRLVRHNITKTRVCIKEMLKSRKLDPFVNSCLHDCFDVYSDAVPLTRKAIKDFRAKRYEDANIDLSTVMDAPTTCEDGFKENEGTVSPLTERNNHAFQLSAMALSIINMLSH